MNKARRKRLVDIKTKFGELSEDLQAVLDEEQEAFDNTPENLQESERGNASSEAIDNIQLVLDSLEEATDNIDDVIEQ